MQDSLCTMTVTKAIAKLNYSHKYIDRYIP